MDKYYVSAIVRDENYATSNKAPDPWLLDITDSYNNIEKAMEVLANIKSDYEVLNAWIDHVRDGYLPQQVYFENNIDVCGYVGCKQKQRSKICRMAQEWCKENKCAFQYMETMYRFCAYSHTEGFIYHTLEKPKNF